jgi:tetratricopeptide (TPR) repeat protein/tRNA A-37 threonylcarbamoyl transferase component Bud32
MPAEVREATATHIEECDACLATLHELEDQNDTLICELRRPVPAALFTKEDHPPRSTEVVQGSMEAAGPPALPGYQVLGQLGQGGMGVVWRGHDHRLRRDVAVKVMKAELAGRPQLSRRFLEEAQVASQLAHPAIPPVHELGELPDGRPYFAMKLVKGRTFADLLEARSSPAEDLPRLLGIFEQVCQAVAYAHSKGVIHRDLKPQNVMVGAFGEVQVMDWGLAKVLATQPATVAVTDQRDTMVETERTAHGDSATQAGAVLGTYAYMAPEQARGEVERLDRRCDVFGLGAMLCEILTGKPPYDGTHEEVRAQAQVAHLAQTQVRLTACGADKELVELARQCLSARVEERPGDAAAVAAAVTAHLSGVQDRLRRAELERAAAEARATEERKRRRVLLALAAAVLALVAVGAAGGLLVQHHAAGRQAEQARREGEQRQAVEFALDRSAGLRQRARWREAQAVLELTLQRLGEAGPHDLRQRLDAAEAELALGKRLDATRQRRVTVIDGKFDNRTAEHDYAVAFREAGLGQVGDDVAAVAARVQASGVFGSLVAALDDWASAVAKPESASWLLRVARQADPDPWRDRFRDLAVWRDPMALRALTEDALRDDGAKLGELSPQGMRTLGLLLGGGAESLPLLRAAQRRHPGDFWLNLQMANALQSANQVDEALGYYLVAVALRPDATVARNNLGAALRGKGNLDGAIVECRKAIELDSRYVPAHYNLGLALRDNRDLDGAIAAYQKAIELDHKCAPAHNNLGNALRDKGDLDGAIREWQKAIELDSGLALAHNNLGNALSDRGDLEGAIAEFHKAIKIDSGLVLAHNNLGATLHRKGDLDGAIASFNTAIALAPKYAVAHHNLGRALQDKPDLDAAIAAYQKASELDPKWAPPHNSLGNILRARGDLEGAIREFRKAVTLDPKHVLAHTNLGAALRAKGDVDGGIVEYRKALEIDPDFPEARCNLGHALRDQGRFSEALDELRRGHALGIKRPGWRHRSEDWVRACERLIELDNKLPAVRNGTAEPAGPAECLEFAQLCRRYKRLHAAAARFYTDAFAAEARLTGDLRLQHRYNAACSAALAAVGQGEDAKDLPDKAVAMLRQQALGWLRDDLAVYAKLAERQDSAARQTVRERMQHLQQNTDLDSVRDAAALDRLADDERASWRQLWADVEALRKEVEKAK